jgi:hypothetical protein
VCLLDGGMIHGRVTPGLRARDAGQYSTASRYGPWAKKSPNDWKKYCIILGCCVETTPPKMGRSFESMSVVRQMMALS